MLNASHECAKVILTHLHALVFHIGADIDKGPGALRFPARNVPAKAGHVAADVFRLFLEGHKHARLAHGNALYQELRGHDGFGTAGTARHQGGAPARKSAIAHMVKSANTCDKLGDACPDDAGVFDFYWCVHG